MKIVGALSASAQPPKLSLFLEIAKHKVGLTSTEAATAAGTLPKTTSVHLSILRDAGLVTSSKKGENWDVGS